MPRSAVLLLLVALTACSHTDPFPTVATDPPAPFDPALPIQLTFSGHDDFAPTLSAPGQLSYQFQRGTPDRDICAGILPVRGGQRIAEVCAAGSEQEHTSDRFAVPVLLDDDQMAWTWHWGGLGNQSPSNAGLYLAPRGGELTRATRKLSLLTRPQGATARWDVLLGARRSGPQQITALAAQWYISPTIKNGPVDTVYLGVELARIDLSTTPATVTVLTPTPDAVDWTVDPGDGTSYVHRRFYAPPTEERLYVAAADTIYRVNGGDLTPVWGRPTSAEIVDGHLNGFTVFHAQLYLSLSHTRVTETAGGNRVSQESLIARVGGDGELTPLAQRINHGEWGRLAVTSDGLYLAVESIVNGDRDIYLVEAQP